MFCSELLILWFHFQPGSLLRAIVCLSFEVLWDDQPLLVTSSLSVPVGVSSLENEGQD